MAELDPKYLKGLKFKTSVVNEVEKDGRKMRQYTPVVRGLKPEDVLSWKDNGETITLVTSDGQKVTVAKEKEKEKEKEKGGK